MIDTQQITINEILARLPDHSRDGGGYRASCPVHHGDSGRSLKIDIKDGQVLLHCHSANCSQADLWAWADGSQVYNPLPAPKAKRKQYKAGRLGNIVKAYQYHDEDGHLLYEHIRRAEPKGFGFRRPKDGGGYIWNLGEVRRVLYRLPELVSSAGPVWIVEGEKDADRLRDAGILATTNDSGAGKWNDDHNRLFDGRQVFICPDNDQDGRKHAELVASRLHETAGEIRIVNLPGLGKKQDVSDWLSLGNTIDELLLLAYSVNVWKPSAVIAAEDRQMALAYANRRDESFPDQYQEVTGKPLTKELFGDGAEMTAQGVHFTGKYAEFESNHCHKTYWRIPVKNGKLTTFSGVEYEAWRDDIYTKGGEHIYCPACKHQRIVEFCKAIERVSLHYWNLESLHMLIVENGKVKATRDRIRQHNKTLRDAGQYSQVSYTTFPMDDRTMFLHDAPDYLGGNELPESRPDLFNLMTVWAIPPRGRRTGHGLESWAKNGPKTAADGSQDDDEKQAGGDEAEAKAGGQMKPVKVGYIWGKNRYIVGRLIAESYGLEFNYKYMDLTGQNIDAIDFIGLLKAAGIDYAIEGEITLSTGSPKDTSTKCEEPADSGGQIASNLAQSEHEVDGIPW